MQTLLAFAFDREVSPETVRAGLDRVEEWYGPLWGEARTAHSAFGSRLGVRLWDDPDEECRWPAWSPDGQGAVAWTHVPLGHRTLVGDVPLSRAPVALARHLQREPADVLRLTAPFVLVTLDRTAQSLALVTDGFGIGRLYELRTADGLVWSNRPVAALRFAGVRAEADTTAWRRMAACDWPMGEATPYAGVRTVAAGTRIEVDAEGHRERSLDVLDRLVGSRREPLTPGSVTETADALVGMARSVSQLWPGVPVLSLSGGRDSRLVVAAFVAAGIEVKLRTYGAAAGEATTARELVGRLGTAVEHSVSVPRAQRVGVQRAGAYARARRWHDVTEGLRPALYLRNGAPKRLIRHRPPLICGVGGEFGHAPGYPDDVERLEQLPVAGRVDAFARSLQAKVVLPRGLSGRALADVDTQVRDVLGHAVARNVSDSKALDWFYADERLRRWGMAGESYGRVMPLLVPEFVTAAWGLSTAQSNASALHRALIDRLVPAWSGIDFYSATLQERQAVRQQRLWEESDVDLLSGVFADPGDWGDAFDVPQVRSIWAAARQGRAAARDELLLQRVVWRAAFTDHLAAVNGAPTRVRPAVSPEPEPEPATAPDLAGTLRSWAARANDIPLARRIARTPLGRQLRRRLGV